MDWNSSLGRVGLWVGSVYESVRFFFAVVLAVPRFRLFLLLFCVFEALHFCYFCLLRFLLASIVLPYFSSNAHKCKSNAHHRMFLLASVVLPFFSSLVLTDENQMHITEGFCLL